MTRKLLIALLPGLLLGAAGCARKPTPLPRDLQDVRRPPEEWLREEPIRLLRDYIRIDTRSEKGERAGAEFLRDLLACEGIETEIVCPAPERCNLLARLPGRTRENSLLLLSHIDVVDAFPQFWKESTPFEGNIKLGYLYGRGAYDMKATGLAQVLALRTLRRGGIVPATDILLLAEADEESGQRWGTRWLLEHRPEWFSGVRQVLNEGGTTEMILRDVRFWGLETVQAGYAMVELESASEAPLDALAKKWANLASAAVSPHPHVVEGFGMLANHLPSPITDPLRHLDRTARDPAQLAVLPDRYGSFLEARIHWSGAYHHPSHPDFFRCYVTVSVPPGVDPELSMRPILDDIRREGLSVVSSSASGVTVASPYPTPFTDLLRRVVEAMAPGIPFGPVPTFGGYTTSVLLRARGFPTYGFEAIPMNITDSARRHGNDERLFLRDYLNGVALYSEVLEEFAVHPPTAN